MKRRILSFVAALFIGLSLALGLALIPDSRARADETVWVTFDPDDPGIVPVSSIDIESEDPIDQLASEVKEHVLKHETEFTIELDSNVDAASLFGTAGAIRDKVVAHTGRPDEGDYLGNNLYSLGSAVYSFGSQKSVTFFASYRMTKDQTNEVSKKEDELLKSLKISGKNDYQKIRAIYDYLTKNIKYDYSKNKDPLVYTPYAALIKKKAVCQGIAVAAYNLMLKAGIDCRVITGSNHAWNIVKLEGKYYYIDATWDLGRSSSKYKYFLKGDPMSKHYPSSDYKTDSFKKMFPISKSDYKGNGKNSGHSPTPAPYVKPTATPTPIPRPSEPPLQEPKTVSYDVYEYESSITVTAGDTIYLFIPEYHNVAYWESSDPEVVYKVPGLEEQCLALKAGRSTLKVTYNDLNDYDPDTGYARKTKIVNVTVLYRDVTNDKDFWFKPTNELTAKGIVKGYDKQTLFKPAHNCTRGQMVTFIWRMQGEPEPKASTCKFSDVKKSDYFYKACIWGNENHIVEGYSDGTFGPKIICARKHAVTFLWRLAKQPEPKSDTNKFKDVKKSDYFYKATLWASEKGILAGYSDGTFRPNGECLRRQMVTFLYKFDQNVNKKK